MKSNVSLSRRLGSIFYDMLLVFSLVFFVTGIVIIAVFDNKAQIDNSMFYTITIPVTYLYFSLSWTKGRQTLGMKAWRFQIIQLNGKNITQKQAFIRFIFAIISLSLMGIGFLYQLFDKNNLSLHDKYSNTILVKN